MDQNAASLKVLADSQKTAFPYVIRVGKLAIEVHKNVFSPKHFNGWKIFHALLPDTKGTDVLEVGTGTGVTAAYMAAHGARSVMALDINPHAVKNARTNARRNSLKNMTVRESNIFSALKKTETF
ncbi:MAG: methyltransferase domain-containing protein, partial [Alphaproteobacteria bacterium]|nr:methyltransferase domain-containing protein [Alphaproteobacteria bacterium]